MKMKKDFRNILKQFKETPPAGFWDRIAAALDDKTVEGKLKNFQWQPPAKSWQAISTALDKQHPTKLKPILKRLTPWMAAAAMLLLVVSSFLLLQQNKKPADVAVQTQTTAAPATLPASPEKNTAPAQQVIPEPSATTNSGEPDKTSRSFTIAGSKTARTDRNPASKEITIAAQTATYHPRVTPIQNQDLFSTSSIVSVDKKITRQDYTTVGEYMIYGADDGSYTRVAKKIFPLLQCATWSSACKEQVKQLQGRISSASLSSGFAGFMDILIQLQENH